MYKGSFLGTLTGVTEFSKHEFGMNQLHTNIKQGHQLFAIFILFNGGEKQHDWFQEDVA